MPLWLVVVLAGVPDRVFAYSDVAQFMAPVLEAGGGGRFYTGTRGDGHTCAVCHGDTRGPDMRIEGFPERYTPGATYLLRVDWPANIEHVALMMEVTQANGRGAGAIALPPPDRYIAEELCEPSELGLLAAQLHAGPDGRQLVFVPDCGARAVYVQWTAPEKASEALRLSGSLMSSNQDSDRTGDGVTPFVLTSSVVDQTSPRPTTGCQLMRPPRSTLGAWGWMVGLVLCWRWRSWLRLLVLLGLLCGGGCVDPDREQAEPGRVHTMPGTSVDAWPEATAQPGDAEDGSAALPVTASPTGGPRMRFSVTTGPVGGKYAPRNVGAIWVSDAEQRWIRTLKVWAQLRERYLQAYWAANPERDRTDAVSSATLRTHQTHEVSWDFTDLDGDQLPAGRYHVHLEVTDRDAPGSVLTIAFEMAPGATDVIATPDGSWFSDAQVTLSLAGDPAEEASAGDSRDVQDAGVERSVPQDAESPGTEDEVDTSEGEEVLPEEPANDGGPAEEPAAQLPQADDCGAIEAACADSSEAEAQAACLAIVDDAASQCAHWRSACSAACNGSAEALQPVVLNFVAQVNSAEFACGDTYPAQGTAATTVEPLDFRFYVQDVELVNQEGQAVRMALATAPPWQHATVALVDFEDGSGRCLEGDPGTHTQVTGWLPQGEYRGLHFKVGVPRALNHGDVFELPDPLRAPRMQWTWLDGYRFMRAEWAEAGGQGIGSLHVGSTVCSGDPALGAVQCQNSNRVAVQLSEFAPESHVVLADIAPLFTAYDLTQVNECHGAGPSCEGMLTALGLMQGPQQVFSAGPRP